MTIKELVKSKLNKDFSNRKELKKFFIDNGNLRGDQFDSVISKLRQVGWGTELPAEIKQPTQLLNPPYQSLKIEPSFKASKTIKINDIRQKHSLPEVVKKYCMSLAHNEVVLESTMLEDINIKQWNGYRDILDSPDFEAYRGRSLKKTYWGHPKAIADLKSDQTLKSINY